MQQNFLLLPHEKPEMDSRTNYCESVEGLINLSEGRPRVTWAPRLIGKGMHECSPKIRYKPERRASGPWSHPHMSPGGRGDCSKMIKKALWSRVWEENTSDEVPTGEKGELFKMKMREKQQSKASPVLPILLPTTHHFMELSGSCQERKFVFVLGLGFPFNPFQAQILLKFNQSKWPM